MTPLETLQALTRLVPDRFDVDDEGGGELKLGGSVYIFDATAPDPEDLALLSAALQELCDSRGWQWLKGISHDRRKPDDYSVGVYGPVEGGARPCLAAVGREGQPFVLTLARAVVAALEATK